MWRGVALHDDKGVVALRGEMGDVIPPPQLMSTRKRAAAPPQAESIVGPESELQKYQLANQFPMRHRTYTKRERKRTSIRTF